MYHICLRAWLGIASDLLDEIYEILRTFEGMHLERPAVSEAARIHTDSSEGEEVALGQEVIFPGEGEMARQMRAKRWTDTPLGNPETWPQSLKIVVRIMLTSRYAMWMAWGSDLIFFCNDAYKPTLGVKQTWALGSSAAKVWEEIWPDIGPRIQTVFKTGTATWDEKLLLFLERSGDPEETYHTFSYSPVPGDDGGIAGMLCVVTEETERVISERRLATLRTMAAKLASINRENEVLAAIEAQLDANQRDLPFTLTYLFEDDGARARLACSTGVTDAHRLAAPPVIDVSAKNSVWPIDELLAQTAPLKVAGLGSRFGALPAGAWDKPPRDAVIVPMAAQGQQRPAGFMVAGINPYRPFDLEYAGFVDLVAGQIASGLANAHAYEKERRRAEALAEIDRAKTLFFSNVSHEFRTPLTLMLGPIEDALNDASASALNDVQRQRLDVAHRNSMRLLRLVNTLLDFSRIEAGRARASYEPIDLAAFTADLASNFRSVTEKAGLALKIDCPPLPEPAHVDRDMWEKIVLNLLSNAFKFTFEGEIAVELSPTADGRAIQLVVRDTGVGIPAAELPLMFERFHRVENQKSRSLEGSGIGLALVQELVKLHGGSLRVDSEAGKGSAFTVSVPRGTAHLPAEHGSVRSGTSAALLAPAFVEEAQRWLAVGGDKAPALLDAMSSAVPDLIHDPMTGRRPRVLLADDNSDMRDYLGRLLGSRFEVEAVADGEAALIAVQTKLPDLILSDVMMPKLDGFGLLRAIRADDRLCELPVILLSARAGDEAKIEGLDAGADDYLVKPFSARELVARVQANLQMAQIRKAAEDALRKRTVELETVLETVPTAVWFTHDGYARQVAGNRHASNLLRIPLGADASLSAPANPRQKFRFFRKGEEAPVDTLPLQRAVRGEDVPEEELEIRFDDGSVTAILISAAPLRDAIGQIHGAVCAAVDITERKRAEEAVRESEGRFLAIAENIPQLAWMADSEGRVEWFNRGWLEYTGTTLEDNLGVGWKGVHHPDHVDVVAEKFARHLREGRDWEDTFPLRGRNGKYRWFLSRMNAIRDPSGTVVRFFGTSTDITERLRAEEQRTLLINELNHRVKNTLATVQSLAMQTMRNSAGGTDIQQRLEARLAALSRAHDMLTLESWEGAGLRDVVKRALEPFRTGEQRVMVEGPDVWLTSKQALALSMALHELATNAAKYGALSNDAGRVRIAWSIAPLDGLGELQLTWTEEGGPPVAPPNRRGFGSRLIERNLAHDLGGDASIDYRHEGVVSIIKSPLERGIDL